MNETNLQAADVLVIGGGPGGYVAAIRAGQLGLETVLVEGDALGGTCLNYGCIPSKALLSATDIVHRSATGEHMGIYADPFVDWSELRSWMSGVVEDLTGGVGQLCRANDVTVIDGWARFEDEEAVVVERDGESDEVRSFEHAIVATGSRAIRPPVFPFEDDRVLTSREVLGLQSLPGELVIVGGGYIGLELATVFAKLGTAVTVIELEDHVLPGWERRLGHAARESLEDMGVSFVLGELASACETDAQEVYIETDDGDGGGRQLSADAVLVAVGREPRSDTCELETAGITPAENGAIPVDERCGTEVEGIYAIGDVTGDPMLAHRAHHDGLVAAEVIAGLDTSRADRTVPEVVYTDPEIAVVGLTPTEAREAGIEVATGRMPYAASGRALALDTREGFVEVIVDGDSGRLVGARAVGHHASELAGELGVAVANDLTAEAVARTVHAHPTLGEAIMEACASAVGEPIHLTN